MPSETPRTPSETYRSLLTRGANRHMGLLAHEVAWYAPDAKWPRRALKTAFACLLLALATGIGLSR